MQPPNLKTKIFLDSGDPAETREALSVLGFLDGQTTNPSLVAKNPATAGRKFSQAEVWDFYRGVVKEISELIPQGSVSIEVYSDKNTPAEKMLEQAKEFNAWIPNAHIKFPTIAAGLKAAEGCVAKGIRVNMTLVFTQGQAAAVYAATRGAKKGDVFLSPFIGRLDDIGENGMDFISNTVKMYKQGDEHAQGTKNLVPGHVEILAASVRSLEHFLQAIKLGSDIITAPLKVLKAWADSGLKMPDENFVYKSETLKSIPYQEISLDREWNQYDIANELTDKGIEKFASDWNNLIK